MPPIVPRYEQRVRPTELPNVFEKVQTDLPLSTFGGGDEARRVNEQTTGAFEKQRKTFEEEVEKADDSILLDAQRKAVEERNKSLYNPTTGAINKKGRDAVGVIDEHGKQYSETLDSIEEGLNERQKDKFKKVRLNNEIELNTALQRHTFVENEKYNKENFASSMDASVEDAALNHSFPGKVGGELDKQEEAIDYFMSGSPKAERDNLKAEMRGKTHLAVLNKMLLDPKQYKLANAYYKETSSTVPEKYQIKMNDLVEEATLLGASQESANNALIKSGWNLTSALNIVREENKDNPKLLKESVRETEARFSEREKALKLDSEVKSRRALDYVDKTGQMPSPTVLNALTPEDRDQVKKHRIFVAEGGYIAENGQVYYDLRTLASYPATKDKFMRLNLTSYSDKVPKNELAKLIELQTNMREGKGDHEKVNDDFRTANDIINGVLRQGGIDPTPKDTNSETAKRVFNFKNEVARQQRSLQEQTGKKATNEDIQRISENLMVKGITQKGYIWNTRKPLFEKKPSEPFEVETKNVPSTERRKIEEALKRRGVEPTDEKVLMLYTQKLKGMQ